ncbi:hypothetical protein OEW28_02680 [Defluviimonas sp. WL0002]|uniref:Uncharacterized protein n=1 Tax=Albidovulum marisflavi TaxID=2984159 RepID=A0ABT2Z8Q7_9RHOB|nr:hypothetical protein [Defluviimonas sp. WL0002]MCV2867529.1 hypothetical protein [Defluviimonas sp. WL0002]
MKTNTLLGAALAAACLPAAVMADDYDLDALKAATEKYKDVNVALAEGFIPDPSGHCISAAHEGLPAELGSMGIHYLRPDLLLIAQGGDRVDGGSTHTDFMTPAILLYEPQEDGSLELVGIENLVFEKAWADAGNTVAPVFNGRSWDHMSDDPATAGDEAHGFMPHFDKHVWIFRDNPSGVDMPFNPNVTCDHMQG